MSPDPDSPKALAFRGDDDDRDVLESLKGLSIRGFFDCTDTPTVNTPTSTSASLPTPPALKTSRVFLATPERLFGGPGWFTPDRPIPAPNAPLMKDFDSFTDGTGQGSFDFPLGPGADEAPMLPLIFHPHGTYDTVKTPTTMSSSSMSNSLALDLLPEPGNLTEAVLAWIEGVSATSPSQPPPKKRRRSVTQDYESEERRTRAWSPIIDSSSSHVDIREVEDSHTKLTEPKPPG